MTHKSHQPSDDKLRAAILARFAADNRTAPANLRVGVLNGIVHLTGVVSSLGTWTIAAELAENVPCVRGVVNRIEAPGAPSPARTIHLNIPSLRTKRQHREDINVKGVSHEYREDL